MAYHKAFVKEVLVMQM